MTESFDGLPRGHFKVILADDALEIGKAAEHLVCADLILSGYRAFLSDQGLPYDVVIDTPDCVHGRIERLVEGPYLELFARTQRPGWTVWGNETDKFAQVAA